MTIKNHKKSLVTNKALCDDTHAHSTNHPRRKTNGFLLTPVVVVAVRWLCVCLIYDLVFVVAKIFITKDTGANKCINRMCCCLNNSDITQRTKLVYAVYPGLSKKQQKKKTSCNHHQINMSPLVECVSDEV